MINRQHPPLSPLREYHTFCKNTLNDEKHIMSRKITLIGAGSVVFAKTLIGDILQREALADSHICLMDIDPQRLKVAEVMMNKIAQKLGSRARVTATLDQREAVRGAKYVICTIQVGGYKPSTVRDFEIPKKYGLKQTIADTLGVGGVFRALRTIPVINSIARDIADVGHPDCLLLNYTNPMAMNCWAVEKAVGIPHVGLCHSVFGTARMLAGHVGLDYEDINYLVAGINHMAFFLKFEYRGKDAYPLLFQTLEDPARSFEHVRYEMMRRTGYFVTESSEHQSEYVPYFIHHGEKIIKDFNIPIDEYIRRCEAINDIWHNTEADLLGKGRDIPLNPPSHEYGSFIIHARESNISQTVYGNVPNKGLIDNLPDDCCVEVPCLVDGNGLQPVKIGTIPSQLAALCQTNINPQRLTVEAALSGKREHIYHALMLDPHTSATLPLDKIWAMCDELIEAHQKDGYLGEFAPVIRNTGRSYAGTGDRVIARLHPEQYDLATAGSDIQLSLDIDNPAAQPRTLELTLSSPDARVQIAEPVLKLSVGAQTTLRHPLTLRLGETSEATLNINLDCTEPDVLPVGVRLQPRQKLDAREAPAAFAYCLSGFPAVKGSVSRKDGKIALQLTVNDSDIQTNAKIAQIGSSTILFFAQSEDSPITELVVAPDKDGQLHVRTLRGQPFAGVTGTVTLSTLDYTLNLLIDPAAIGLRNSDSFLMDAITKINALGDAHSGGSCALGGSTSHYASTVNHVRVLL